MIWRSCVTSLDDRKVEDVKIDVPVDMKIATRFEIM